MRQLRPLLGWVGAVLSCGLAPSVLAAPPADCIPRSELASVVSGEGEVMTDVHMTVKRIEGDNLVTTGGPIFEGDHWVLVPVGGRLSIAPRLSVPLGSHATIRSGPKGVTFRLQEAKTSKGTPCVKFEITAGEARIERK